MQHQAAFDQLQLFLAHGEKDVFFDNPFIGITITDEKGNVLKVNPSQSRITGMAPNFWVGQNFFKLVDEGTVVNSGTVRVLESQKPETVRQNLCNGKSFFVQSYPVNSPDGRMRYVLSYLIDMSDLACLKQELKKVRHENLQISKELYSLHDVLSQDKRMIYASKKIQSLVNMMDLVADSDTTVLITGASGVGKEMIAREIHNKSPRRNNPFMKISCEAIPATLLESELFGYEPGSFTGASKQGKRGLLEEGNKGTIFLDEIGEIPPALQVKLLQVLQEHCVRRIGGAKKIPVDIRVIAATNADLRKLIVEKKFREDLFYRLNVIPIRVPRLDERKEDIPLLAQHFLNLFNAKYSKHKTFSINAAAYLASLSYDGNVRQLRNLIERAILLSPDTTISIEDINVVYYMRESHDHSDQERISNKSTLKALMEEKEREVLRAAWMQYKNTHSIARALQVSQPTISRKLKKYRISDKPERTQDI